MKKKITKNDVAAIRDMMINGSSPEDVAKHYGITRNTLVLQLAYLGKQIAKTWTIIDHRDDD